MSSGGGGGGGRTFMTIVATAAASAAVTYYTTLIHRIRQEQNQRRLDYEAKKEEREREQEKQQQRGDPPGRALQSAGVDKIFLWEVEHLGERFGRAEDRGNAATGVINVMHHATPSHGPSSSSTEQQQTTAYNKLIGDEQHILADIVRTTHGQRTSIAYVRAGPREYLHFDPKKVNAAIVTCGGLCPGLNNVVREITNTLHQLYGIGGSVYGIRGGFKGFYDPQLTPLVLTPHVVENIHHEGGTFLGSSRGGFDLEKILHFLRHQSINCLFVIGGDGTHRGAFKIHEGCMEAGLNVSVAGIPKTIDNDVDYIDRSFGFGSAVEAAQNAIRSAKTEATCNLPNGIGVVKLMGRSAGFIAVHATMASGDVDLCLVPEVPTVLDGPMGCMPHLRRRVQDKGYAVVVVAEGAGEELLGESTETDASGNKKLPKIGEFIKSKIEEHFRTEGDVATVKYIDPSYMIRSIPANAADSLYCMQLAQNAVHGAMAGFTGFSVGLCNNRMVLLPIPELVATSPRSMNPRGRTWERVLAVTRQPNTVPPLKEGEVETRDSHAPMLR